MHFSNPMPQMVLLLTAVAIASARSEDWPQWRGPNRDGISQEKGLLKEWPKEGPKLVWQVKDLGGGYGSPSIVEGRIFVMSNKGIDDESVKALNVSDGSTIWSTRIGKVGNPDQRPSYPAARSTPTFDAGMLYALSSDGDLACLEAATGKLQWTKNLRKDFGGKPGTWAYAESPLVVGNQVVCIPGGAEATVVALDKKTGNTIWKTTASEADLAGYSSLTVADSAAGRQYLAYTAGGLLGIDAKSGKLLWRYDRTKGAMGMSILTPVTADGLIYTGAGRVGGASVKVTAEQGKFTAEEAYFDTKLPTAIGGAVLIDHHLYGSGGQTLVCADFKTGMIKWTDRSVAPGSLCYADGRLYLHGEGGEMVLVETTTEAYREHGKFTPSSPPKRTSEREKSWAYPAIANGRLYVRDTDSLWCFDIKDPAAAK